MLILDICFIFFSLYVTFFTFSITRSQNILHSLMNIFKHFIFTITFGTIKKITFVLSSLLIIILFPFLSLLWWCRLLIEKNSWCRILLTNNFNDLKTFYTSRFDWLLSKFLDSVPLLWMKIRSILNVVFFQ